jgi:superfamily II DNA/RNA helicase
MELTVELTDLLDTESEQLREIIAQLSSRPTDPKLEAVLHYLIEREWLELGCIVFSQYFDTAEWIAGQLSARLPAESVAVYAGADRSCVYFDREPRKVKREQIKQAVKERRIRLVVATDAACEGLNLQTLGTLINVDLPWNPSRLEQRIGRIKRFGQTRDRVDMLNLVYKGTHDERIYAVLSKRMKDRYDLLGSLPDVIEDAWIDDLEHLDEELAKFTEKRTAANAFDLRYGDPVEPEGPGWAQCEKVLARHDIVERLSRGWRPGG